MLIFKLIRKFDSKTYMWLFKKYNHDYILYILYIVASLNTTIGTYLTLTLVSQAEETQIFHSIIFIKWFVYLDLPEQISENKQ